MRREVKDFEGVIEILENLCVEWETTNKIQRTNEGVSHELQVR